jgi:hypothetical protein
VLLAEMYNLYPVYQGNSEDGFLRGAVRRTLGHARDVHVPTLMLATNEMDDFMARVIVGHSKWTAPASCECWRILGKGPTQRFCP